MTWSRAQLRVEAHCGTPVPLRAIAQAPQRWTVARRGQGAWLEAYHQLIGEGSFGGDRAATRISATEGAACIVRGISATPLRRGESCTVVRLAADSGATLIYLPGALVPHAGANHTSAVAVHARRGGRVLAASLLTPGRAGSGERLVFERLRLRTRVVIDGEEWFAEDTESGDVRSLDGPGGFAGAGVYVNILAAGPWAVTRGDWWPASQLPGSMVGGPSELAPGLLVFRALCGTLGDANAFVNAVAERITTEYFESGAS